jgi:DNA-binding MarR family transcriptional regulator
MHRMVIGLERRGFVKRHRKTDDKKLFYLSLSPSGIQILHQAELILKAEQDVLKKQFEPQELDALYALLQRFEATFKNRNNKGGRTDET